MLNKAEYLLCTDLIRNAKISYIKKSNAFNDTRTDPKVYWTILNNFLNNSLSAPSVLISGKAITNIVKKANVFNEIFASSVENLISWGVLIRARLENFLKKQ